LHPILKAYANFMNKCFLEALFTYLKNVSLKSFLMSLLQVTNKIQKNINEFLKDMKIDKAKIGFNH
jgi:hypothetical protein